MIDILLATHNGEAYLAQQLDSLLSQTVQDFRILIQDDHSQDRTLGLVRQYCDAFPERLCLCQAEGPLGGAAQNFLSLAAKASGDYVAFCDQDDVWLPDKLETSLAAMARLEEPDGGATPALVFSRVCPVDKELQKLPVPSEGGDVSLTFPRLLVQGCASGCTMLLNRALYTRLGAYDSRILMHDWWALLVAASLGRVAYLPRELVLYRQHGANAVGYTGRRTLAYWLRRAGKEKPLQKKDVYYGQARLLEQRLGGAMKPSEHQTLLNFLAIPEGHGKLRRMWALWAGGFRKDSAIAQAVFMISI